MDESFYIKFPWVLQEALKNNIVSFPENVEIEYNEYCVYRVIERKANEDAAINDKDFLSQMELYKKYDKKLPRGCSENDIGAYSCSVFKEISELSTVMRLPRRNKKIIKGIIKSVNGPIRQSKNNSHVDVWLYDNSTMPEQFAVYEEKPR